MNLIIVFDHSVFISERQTMEETEPVTQPSSVKNEPLTVPSSPMHQNEGFIQFLAPRPDANLIRSLWEYLRIFEMGQLFYALLDQDGTTRLSAVMKDQVYSTFAVCAWSKMKEYLEICMSLNPTNEILEELASYISLDDWEYYENELQPLEEVSALQKERFMMLLRQFPFSLKEYLALGFKVKMVNLVLNGVWFRNGVPSRSAEERDVTEFLENEIQSLLRDGVVNEIHLGNLMNSLPKIEQLVESYKSFNDEAWDEIILSF